VDFTGGGICTVRAADKEQRGVSEVLPSKARRVDSGGGVIGEAASPLPISEGVGQRCELSQPAGPRDAHSTIFLYFEVSSQLILLRFKGKQLQKSLNLSVRGLHQPPWGQNYMSRGVAT